MEITTISALLTAAGLLLTFGGALWAAHGSMVKDAETAFREQGGGFASVNMEENFESPAVKRMLRGSQAARDGLWVIAAGTLLQLIGLGIPFIF